MTGFYTLVHPTMYRNQWNFCLEVYRSISIEHSYLANPPFQLGVYNTWSIVCPCKHLLNTSVVTNHFCLDTLECSHSWCVYTDNSKLTGYDVGHQVHVLHSSIHYSCMSPEWTTVCHSPPHGLKKFQSWPVWPCCDIETCSWCLVDLCRQLEGHPSWYQ